MSKVESQQVHERDVEQSDVQVIASEEIMKVPEKLKGLSNEMEALRQEIITLHPEAIMSKEDETDQALDSIKKVNKARQKANILIEAANSYLPDDRLESGQSLYGKISLLPVNTESVSEAKKEWEAIKSEKQAAKVKNKLRQKTLDALQEEIAEDGEQLRGFQQSLEKSVADAGAQLSGITGIWNKVRGKTRSVEDQQSVCRSIAKSLEVFLEENTQDKHFSVKHSSQVDRVVEFVKDESNEGMLRAAGVDVQKLDGIFQGIKEKTEKKNTVFAEKYGVDSKKIRSVESKIISLMQGYRSETKPPDVKEVIDVWVKIKKMHDELGVGEESEKIKVQELGKKEGSEAVRLGTERSFKNIRESIFLYAKTRIKAGENPEALVAELRQEAEKAKESLTLSYNETAGDIAKIVDSGKIINLFEHSPEEQDERKKSWSSTSEVLHNRKMIDGALGWKDENVYHLAVDDASNNATNGSANEYGSVRLQFGYNTFLDKTTFTESDSLNPRGLPQDLSDKRSFESDSRGVVDRQISAEHLPYAKAIFNLLEKQNPSADGKEMRYIEAQIGGIEGKDIIDNLAGIVIDVKEFKREAKSAKVDESETIEKIKKFCKERSIQCTLV